VELDHSRDVVADLLGVVVEALSEGLRVEKLEGDAVFCVGEPQVDADALLVVVEGAYLSFARRRRTIALATSCPCDACRRIPDLDLKFLVHRGTYAEHEVAGRRELIGPDVVMAHRLLKNSVRERTGIASYAFITDAAIDGAGVLEAAPTHAESYEDAGSVEGRVLDLAAAWEREQSESEIKVAAGEGDFEFEATVVAPREVAWKRMTVPEEQLTWRIGLDSYDETNLGDGRGVGTTAHCVHGKDVNVQEIVDWKPLDHYSFKERNPGGPCLWTVELDEVPPDATIVRWRVALSGGIGQRALMIVARPRMRRVLSANFEALVTSLGGRRD